METKIEKQTTKICRICEIELPLSSFAKHSQCRLGVENTCRACKKRKPSATKPSPNRMPVVINTGNQPDTAAHKIDSGNVIMLNLEQMDGLYEKIKKIADDEFRTIENQIMYLLSKHIGKHAEQTQ